MAVYLEPVAISGGGYRISRLRGDTTAELDAFVVAAGITAPRVAHPIVTTLDCYELSWRERRRALRAGAQECDWSETYRRLARLIVAGGPEPVASVVSRSPDMESERQADGRLATTRLQRSGGPLPIVDQRP